MNATFKFDGETYSLASMLEANAHDTELCEWLKSASVGDRFCGVERAG